MENLISCAVAVQAFVSFYQLVQNFMVLISCQLWWKTLLSFFSAPICMPRDFQLVYKIPVSRGSRPEVFCKNGDSCFLLPLWMLYSTKTQIESMCKVLQSFQKQSFADVLQKKCS